MALKFFEENVSVHQTLGDNPNTDNSLSAAELKALFDKPAEMIQAFINEHVVPAVNQMNGTPQVLEAGKEYETGEMWLGHKVYTYVFRRVIPSFNMDTANIVGTTSAKAPDGIDFVPYTVVRHTGVLVSEGKSETLPTATASARLCGEADASTDLFGNEVRMNALSYAATVGQADIGKTLYLQAWYIKEAV